MMNEQLLKALISLGVFIIAYALLHINNNRKIKRARQFPFLFVTPLVMIAELVLLIGFRNEVLNWLSLIPVLQSFLQTVLSNTGIMNGIEILFFNVLLLIPYLIIKAVLRPVFSLITKRSRTHFVLRWYNRAEEPGEYFLKNSQINLRSLWGVVTLSLGLCVIAVSTVNWIVGPGSILWTNMYPAAAWVIVAEIYWFIAGCTEEEYKNSIGGMDSSVSERSNYGKLKQVLESVFPESLLTEHTGKEYSDRIGSGNYLHQLLESEDKADQFAARFFLHLPGKKEGAFDVDLIKSCVNLMHHQSTVIFNPFYHDLDDYLTLPLMNMLLSGRKILVVCGRQSMAEDVSHWIQGLLNEYCRTDRLWKTGLLDETGDKDVGILSFSNLYDPKVLNGNGEFFQQVGFVLLIEVSRMLTTAQAGLGIVVGKMDKLNQPVFCAIDREADGLVDLLSHLFLQNVTNVVAAPPILPLYSLMGWDADGDYHRQTLFQQQTHFLGNGTELAATALKYEIPEVSWYSEEKVPVHDLRWISRQYYRQICRYAGIPNSQESLDQKLHFIANPLDSHLNERAFIIAEDECCNLFATARCFLTRATKDLFVNVISENYLLRDYMRFNWRLFMNDPKAIPIITPHYAKTERNTVMRLVILMSGEPLREEYIRHEMQMLGYMDDDVFGRISSLITKYLNISQTIISITQRKEFSLDDIPIPVLYYQIPRELFETECAKTLRNAFFVVEDEKLETESIDARMFQHITQLVMPGQQIVHGGKLYQVHKVSPDVGCILHRAADLYVNRLYYRQLRCYRLNDLSFGSNKEQYAGEIISHRIVGDVDITILSMDFNVNATGYLEMKDQHDLRTARKIDLSEDPSFAEGNYFRSYKNRSVMKLKLQGTNKYTRYTISLLLSELLKTVFPYSWHFIAVLAEKSLDPDGMLNCMTYDVEGLYDPEAIYILEDSMMDLGLLEAIDYNLFRIFEILADYLNWHTEKMMEPPQKDPAVIKPLDIQVAPKVSFFKRIWNRVTGIFKTKKQNEEPDKLPPAQEKEEKEPENKPFEEMNVSDEEKVIPLNTVETVTDEEEPSDRKDAPDEKTEEIPVQFGDDEFIGFSAADDDLDLQMPVPQSKYDESCFLKFGYEDIDSAIAVDDVRVFLNSHGYGNNSLYRARKPQEAKKPQIEGGIVCDFCGMPLTGVQYDHLEDGRIRCGRCSASAINDVAVFRSLFQDTLFIMEQNYQITYRGGINVQTIDAKKMGRLSGVLFKPTPGFDARVLGLATHRGKTYEMYIENGSPRLEALSTMAHELTHIWQYQNWNRRKIKSLYKKDELLVYEGMAGWVQIQTLYILGEFTYASDQENLLNNRDDEYGTGFRMFVEKYGMNRSGTVNPSTPFNVFPPL